MKQAEAYLHAVRRGLADAPAEDRERLMNRLTEAVSAYLEEDPEAAETDIIKIFGTPESCAAELLEECDPSQVAAVRRRKRVRLYAIIAVLAAVACIVLTVLVFRKDTGSSVTPIDSIAPTEPMEPVENAGDYPLHTDHHGAGHH